MVSDRGKGDHGTKDVPESFSLSLALAPFLSFILTIACPYPKWRRKIRMFAPSFPSAPLGGRYKSLNCTSLPSARYRGLVPTSLIRAVPETGLIAA